MPVAWLFLEGWHALLCVHQVGVMDALVFISPYTRPNEKDLGKLWKHIIQDVFWTKIICWTREHQRSAEYVGERKRMKLHQRLRKMLKLDKRLFETVQRVEFNSHHLTLSCQG